MLGLALATSNAPAIYRPRSAWQAIYDKQKNEGTPPPNELADETDEIADGYAQRIQAAVAALRDQLKSHKPDVVVMLGYDDGVTFSGIQVPQFCTFTGEKLTGSASIAELGESPEQNEVSLACDTDFAWEVHQDLIDRGFDMSYMSIQNPVGRAEWGVSSAFTRPATTVLQGLDIPVVPIFINCAVEPTPPGQRCYAFGQALGQILERADKKVAVLAVGGLSHDPGGPRAGWIDNRLDKWVLNNLVKGDSQRLKTLFDLDSDTLRGGTGQVRTWIAAAAAAETKNGKAKVVDYIPALRTMTGLGFAYWDLTSAKA